MKWSCTNRLDGQVQKVVMAAWGPVRNRIFHRLAVGPVKFIAFINDLDTGSDYSTRGVFADEIKCGVVPKCTARQVAVQTGHVYWTNISVNVVLWNRQSPARGHADAIQLTTALQKIPRDPSGMRFGQEAKVHPHSKTFHQQGEGILHRFWAVVKPLLVCCPGFTAENKCGHTGRSPVEGPLWWLEHRAYAGSGVQWAHSAWWRGGKVETRLWLLPGAKLQVLLWDAQQQVKK